MRKKDDVTKVIAFECFHFWPYYREECNNKAEIVHKIQQLTGAGVFYERRYRIITVRTRFFLLLFVKRRENIVFRL